MLDKINLRQKRFAPVLWHHLSCNQFDLMIQLDLIQSWVRSKTRVDAFLSPCVCYLQLCTGYRLQGCILNWSCSNSHIVPHWIPWSSYVKYFYTIVGSIYRNVKSSDMKTDIKDALTYFSLRQSFPRKVHDLKIEVKSWPISFLSSSFIVIKFLRNFISFPTLAGWLFSLVSIAKYKMQYVNQYRLCIYKTNQA